MLVAPAAQAQQDSIDEPESHAVVQPSPNSPSHSLNAALARLGQNPRDVAALIDAGNAALAIGDLDASSGFFRRADQIAPNDPRVKAGWARALVRSGNPYEAIPLFDAAERAGANDSGFMADHGLAYDLVGDNATAQRFYRQALTGGPNDEATRRLALSLAISGDKRGAESTLSPLLQRQDKAAWRVRVFALAILGKPDEAVLIANSTLPPSLAQGIAPYIRYMPRLTPAQQAAAANFGNFPRASEIGHDDPRIAQFTRSQSRPGVAAADTGLIPSGEPLGRRDRSRGNGSERRDSQARQSENATATASNNQSRSRQRDAHVAPPDLQPTRVETPVASAATVTRAPVPKPVSGSQALARPTSAPAATAPVTIAATRPATAMAATPSAPPSAQPVVRQTGPAVAAPGFDLAQVSPAPVRPAAVAAPPPVAAAPPAPATSAPPPPAAPPAPSRRPSLAEAFSDLARPTIDDAPAAGAVDIRRIRPAREVAASAKPPPPAHPSRIWVQVATGRDKSGLSYDWRRMTHDAGTALRGKQPFISAWGQTNRLLTGPFASEAAANAFIAQMRREDVTGLFVWTSPAGQVVDALPTRQGPAR